MEGTSGESLSNGVLSRDSSGTQFPDKLDNGENLVEKLMSPLVLTEAKYKFLVKGGNAMVASLKHIGD